MVERRPPPAYQTPIAVDFTNKAEMRPWFCVVHMASTTPTTEMKPCSQLLVRIYEVKARKNGTDQAHPLVLNDLVHQYRYFFIAT